MRSHPTREDGNERRAERQAGQDPDEPTDLHTGAAAGLQPEPDPEPKTPEELAAEAERLKAERKMYERFLTAASVFWKTNLPAPRPDSWIIVDAMHHDLRVLLRNLTIANALRRIEPSRLLLVTGTDAEWERTVLKGFDPEKVADLAHAFGADAVIDVHELADRVLQAPPGEPPVLEVGGRRLVIDARHAAQAGAIPVLPAQLETYTRATFCRLDLLPRLPAGYQDDPRYRARYDRAATFSTIYDCLFAMLRPVAMVTAHVDYDQWGLAVESALRMDVPVIHMQCTGALKAYAIFPERLRGEQSVRAELTRQIGEFFERRLWPERDRLRSATELVAWRSRKNLGRPSWWRRDTAASCELRTPAERRQFRRFAAEQVGLDPDRPIISVYNHAVSDALGTNIELFDDLAEWFERTAAHAKTTPEVGWLFLDHPSQGWYDSTGFFDELAGKYSGQTGMAFRRSADLSKNALWSMTDLGLTVRGSIGNELPAFGTPVIQAGWSEWSACGISSIAEDQESYWKRLDRSVEALSRGEPLIEIEQVRRARIWLWFYRSFTDVVSPLMPHWEIRPEKEFLRVMETHLKFVESDQDPLFSAVERMWTRREPFLTRFDTALLSDSPRES